MFSSSRNSQVAFCREITMKNNNLKKILNIDILDNTWSDKGFKGTF